MTYKKVLSGVKLLYIFFEAWFLFKIPSLGTKGMAGTVCQSSDFFEFQGEGREGGVGIPSWLGSASWRNQIIDGF